MLFEGAQATLLDLNYGTYPFVTSSHPTVGGILVGAGVNHKAIHRVYGVAKAFNTRVGHGPFATEVSGDMELRLRGDGSKPWDEFGTTTGRARRVGWLDLELLRYAVDVNGLDGLVINKMDILAGLETHSGLHPLRRRRPARVPPDARLGHHRRGRQPRHPAQAGPGVSGPDRRNGQLPGCHLFVWPRPRADLRSRGLGLSRSWAVGQAFRGLKRRNRLAHLPSMRGLTP